MYSISVALCVPITCFTSIVNGIRECVYRLPQSSKPFNFIHRTCSHAHGCIQTTFPCAHTCMYVCVCVWKKDSAWVTFSGLHLNPRCPDFPRFGCLCARRCAFISRPVNVRETFYGLSSKHKHRLHVVLEELALGGTAQWLTKHDECQQCCQYSQVYALLRTKVLLVMRKSLSFQQLWAKIWLDQPIFCARTLHKSNIKAALGSFHFALNLAPPVDKSGYKHHRLLS